MRALQLWRQLWAHPQSPLWLTYTLVAIAWLFIRPFGDFPLNDDWTFAHFAKHWAETGSMKLDAPSSPNVVGQALIGGLLIRLFGFSHVVLRVATMALSLVGLGMIDRILAWCGTSKESRTATLLTVAFNPIFFYSATTFMTELWGWMWSMGGAFVWFWGRRRASERVLVSWPISIAAGALIGLAFWTRQICVLVYPALLGSALLRAAAQRNWRLILRSAPALLLGVLAFGCAIALYFPWAKSTGNFRPEFAERIGHLGAVVGRAYSVQVGAMIVYMTAYFLPLLLLIRTDLRRLWGVRLAGALGIFALIMTARSLLQQTAPSDFWIGPIWTHRVFPYLVNIVWNAGIGPLTFDDTFFYDVPTPRWSGGVWAAIEWTLIAVSVLWVQASGRWYWAVKAAKDSWQSEVLLTGALLLVGGTVAIIQVHQMEMVDRYHLPLILGAALALPPLISFRLNLRSAVAACVLMVLAAFVVLGTHDQFRMAEARWALFEVARGQGGTRATIQGGYEMNCFWRYERLSPSEVTCGTQCKCAYNGFCCLDDEWRVGLSVFPGYRTVDERLPPLLLAPAQPVILSRRAR